MHGSEDLFIVRNVFFPQLFIAFSGRCVNAFTNRRERVFAGIIRPLVFVICSNGQKDHYGVRILYPDILVLCGNQLSAVIQHAQSGGNLHVVALHIRRHNQRVFSFYLLLYIDFCLFSRPVAVAVNPFLRKGFQIDCEVHLAFFACGQLERHHIGWIIGKILPGIGNAVICIFHTAGCLLQIQVSPVIFRRIGGLSFKLQIQIAERLIGAPVNQAFAVQKAGFHNIVYRLLVIFKCGFPKFRH